MTTAPIVISLCDRTGVAVRPWAAAGYECWCVDVQHSIRRERVDGLVHFVWGDARSWCPPAGRRIAFLMAFPPCTHVAVSGARDMRQKAGWMLADALQLFDACQVAAAYSGAPYLIENPVGRLNTHRRKPDYLFHPWEYAGYLPDVQTDNTSKKTCIWTGGGFVMPAPRPAPGPHREDCFMAPPSDDRADERAVTPEGFARAVFLANRPAPAATEAA